MSSIPGAPVKEQMAHRLKTPEGKALYKQRKQTVEPVFGIIKEVLGFRRFSMRGKEKAETEWSLVCLSYNLKKLFKLMAARVPASPAEAAKQHASAHLGRFCTFFAAFLCKSFAEALHLRALTRYNENVAGLTPTGC